MGAIHYTRYGHTDIPLDDTDSKADQRINKPRTLLRGFLLTHTSVSALVLDLASQEEFETSTRRRIQLQPPPQH